MILRLRGSARNPKSCFYPSLYRRSRRYKVIVEVLTKSRLLINRAIRPIIYMSIGLDMHEVISSTLIVSTKTACLYKRFFRYKEPLGHSPSGSCIIRISWPFGAVLPRLAVCRRERGRDGRRLGDYHLFEPGIHPLQK